MEPKPFVRDTLFYLNIIGANPENQTIWAKARATLTSVLGTTVSVFIILDLVLNWTGIETLLEDSAALVAIMESVIKTGFLLVYKDRIEKLLECIQQFWVTVDIGADAKQKVEPIYTFVEKFRKGIKICYISTNLIFFVKPIIFGTKIIPITVYQPFDFLLSPRYEIVYFLEYLNGNLLLVSMLAFDLLFILFVTHTVCQLKMLQCEFASLKINPNVQGNEEACLKDISRLIEYHNFVLRFITEMKDLFDFVMLTEFVSSTFCICLGLFSLSGEGFPPSPTIAAKYFTFMLSYTGELYFLCYSGNVIAEESTNVIYAVYKSGWWMKTQPKLRRALVLVIVRAQKAEKLTVGGMFYLDLNCFTTVINKAFSIFTLMQAMQTEENEELC